MQGCHKQVSKLCRVNKNMPDYPLNLARVKGPLGRMISLF